MWSFRKRRSPAEVAALVTEIRADVSRRMIQEDLEFDEYCALSDRPRISGLMRMIESTEPFMCHDLIDWDHYAAWCKQRREGSPERPKTLCSAEYYPEANALGTCKQCGLPIGSHKMAVR